MMTETALLPFRDRVEVLAFTGEFNGLVYVGTYVDGGRQAFPGGGVEQGETPEAAAEREFLEETGCRLISPRRLDVPPFEYVWRPPFTEAQLERRKYFRGSRTIYVWGRLGPKVAEPVDRSIKDWRTARATLAEMALASEAIEAGTDSKEMARFRALTAASLVAYQMR